SCVQYGRQLHDEYELAVLFAGYNIELPRSNGRPGGPELRLSCRGTCCGRCADSRVRAAHLKNDRKLLGGYDARHALRVAADLDSVGLILRLAGLYSEF